MSVILIDQDALLLVLIDMHPKASCPSKLAFEILRKGEERLRHAFVDEQLALTAVEDASEM